MESNKKIRQLLYCWLGVALIRILIVSNFPILANPDAGIDDGLMIDRAMNLIFGRWLGAYDFVTLSKGPGLSFLLAFCCITGIPFLTMESIIYSLGCIMLSLAIRPLFKKDVPLTLLYLFLLFNPVSMASETYQRVYRNGIVLGFELMVIGAFVAVFIRYRSKAKAWVKWMIVGGFALTLALYTRDDFIWIMPFVACAFIIVAGLVIKEHGIKCRHTWVRIGILFIPFLIYAVGTIAISTVNYKVYGIYTVTDTSGTYFSKAIKAMYSVEDTENIPYVSVSRKKLEQLYDVSPTLNSIREGLNARMDYWEGCGRAPGDGEVEDGWFYWTLRQAVADYGYYENAHTSELFYKNVYREIETAIKDGRLDIRLTMPSALMSPWRKGYGKLLVSTMKDANNFIVSFSGIGMAASNATNMASEPARIEMTETLTHNQALYDVNYFTERPQRTYIRYIDRLCGYVYKVFALYEKYNRSIYYISIFAFVVLIIDIIYDLLRKRFKYVQLCVIVIGLVLSYILFIAGVSYTHISAFSAMAYMYLSCAYPLILTIEGILLLYLIDKVCEIYKLMKMRVGENGIDNFNALFKRGRNSGNMHKKGTDIS